MTSTKFWFLLVDYATGQPYKGTTADFVSLSPDAVIVQFRDAVHLENSSILTGIAPSQLLVYKNKAAFCERSAAVDEGKGEPLTAARNLDGLGDSEEEALIVVVPSPRSSSQITTDLCLIKEPSHKRKQRWTELNKILGRNAQNLAKTNNDSTSDLSVTWSQVEPVFAPVKKYVQPQRAVDDAQLDFLAQYLSYTTMCFQSVTIGNDAKCRHLIAPILVCVCVLLDGNVEILTEEDLIGKYVQARGHFEFILKRGTKAVCIVQAKKDDLEQGMAHDFVGCEVAAELWGLDVVYGIVTNYIQWNFLRSLNDKVEMEECSFHLSTNGPKRESLKEIAGKIYSMLADEDTQTE